LLHTEDDYRIGITAPGVPGLIMGRTRNVSAGFTYGFMDLVDYFIEDCRDGADRWGDGYRPLEVRRETVRRKNHPAVETTAYESAAGTLETDPRAKAAPNGLFLARAFSAARGGAAQSLHALWQWPQAQTVMEAQQVLRNVSISGNWLIADRTGNIGYQQSGTLPLRQHSGLYPVPAWDQGAAWRGIAAADELATRVNPSAGFLVTANDDWNQPGMRTSINGCQGPYRARRIAELLTEQEKLTLADMQRIQSDLFSIQARRYMEMLRPMIPRTARGEMLLNWDLRYDVESAGASLFEEFYRRVMRAVFGTGLFGAPVWDEMLATTNLFHAYFHRFDDILLGAESFRSSRWFPDRGRDELFRSVLETVVGESAEPPSKWGERRQVMMRNVLLGGKLPAWLNRLVPVDYGPIQLPGNRSTIVQGGIFRNHGRASTFAPSYRAITDMGTDEVHTALAGGPSERVLSPLYTADVERWLRFEYKRLSAATRRGQSETEELS
jgi:penicillin amidase